MVGSMYSLTCFVTGAEKLTDHGAMVTYQWFKNGAVVPGQTMVTLSSSSLTFSDAGTFTCQATVTSSLLRAPITTNMANPVSIRLTCGLYCHAHAVCQILHIFYNSNCSNCETNE